MKLSIILSIILFITLYTSNTSAQSASISNITPSLYRNVSQSITIIGTGFTAGTNLTLKNTFTFYGISLLCPETVFINSTLMTCQVPDVWASDYTSIYLNNSYVSKYLSVVSAKINFINITSSTSVFVNGDGFLPNSTMNIQLYNNTKVPLSCDYENIYKTLNCYLPEDNLLTDCFKLNYADSFYSASINYYLAPTFKSVELLGNALKLDVDSHCPSSSPSYSLNINSISFSSISKADAFLFFQPSFDLCTAYSKKFNFSLTSSFYTYGTVKLESNTIFFDCEIGKAYLDNSEEEPIPIDPSSSDSNASNSLFNSINFSIIFIIISTFYLIFN